MIDWLFKVFVATIISFIIGLISFSPLFFIAALICRYRKDESHPVMPMSETYFASLMVVIVFCYSFYLIYGRFDRIMDSLRKSWKRK